MTERGAWGAKMCVRAVRVLLREERGGAAVKGLCIIDPKDEIKNDFKLCFSGI